MGFLIDLWLPILLSAVFVFIVSSILHMVVSHHGSDHRALPDESAVLKSLREHGIPRGNYVFPHASSKKEMSSPAMLEKYERGPVGFATILPPGPMDMGKSLTQWFVFSLIVSTVTAYLTDFVFDAGADYMGVFRVSGTVAFMGYALSSVPDSIWKGLRWSTTMKFVLDGTIYALVTAGTFGWLWPSG